MKYWIAGVALALAVGVAASAQAAPFVRAAGQGTVGYKPDQMKITVGVTTRADTAQQAADDNAARSSVLIDALKKLLGADADLRTISYSVSPVYQYPTGGTAVIVGYSAANSLDVTTSDLSISGRVIDVAVQAGANTIGSIRFALKDPQPVRQAALKLATQQARAAAEAMASGLGARLGAVRSVEESGSVTVVNSSASAGGASSSTPVESGTLQYTASVVVEAELVP